VTLPAPESDFSFIDARHAELFKLPGAQVVSDATEFGHDRAVRVDDEALLKRLVPRGAGMAHMWLPERSLRYRYPKDVTPAEAQLAVQEALKRAGWTLEPSTGARVEARFPAAGRDITLQANFYDEHGTANSRMTLRDPLHQEREAPVQGAFEAFGEFLFAPAWRGPSLADESRFQLTAASDFMMSRARRKHPDTSIAVVVAPAGPAARMDEAKAMAARVRSDLVALGWDEKRVHAEALDTSSRENPHSTPAVRIALYECGTRKEDRPGRVASICRCWRERAPDWVRPGACP
jgi:hypothetical protein